MLAHRGRPSCETWAALFRAVGRETFSISSRIIAQILTSGRIQHPPDFHNSGATELMALPVRGMELGLERCVFVERPM
jgi:hypothetical protein